MKRFCKAIGLKEEKREEYESLHSEVWPAVNATISECNIRNFTIFTRQFPDARHYLILYFEYVGADFEADMKRMAADPETRRWRQLTDPCQEPFPDRLEGEWWAGLRELCHNP